VSLEPLYLERVERESAISQNSSLERTPRVSYGICSLLYLAFQSGTEETWGGPVIRTVSRGSTPSSRAYGPAHHYPLSRCSGAVLRTNQPVNQASSDNPSDNAASEGEV